jgi:hypothetical protein
MDPDNLCPVHIEDLLIEYVFFYQYVALVIDVGMILFFRSVGRDNKPVKKIKVFNGKYEEPLFVLDNKLCDPRELSSRHDNKVPKVAYLSAVLVDDVLL